MDRHETHAHPSRGPLLVALATCLTWLGLLGWDNAREVRDSVETGPYETWQVVAVVAVLAVVYLVALASGQDAVRVNLALSGTITACMILSFTVLAPPAPDASLWPIGAALIALTCCSSNQHTCQKEKENLSASFQV